MQLRLDRKNIYQRRTRKIQYAKLKIEEIKAKVNSLEKELLEIKYLDKLLLNMNYNTQKKAKTTIYKTDNIILIGKLVYQRYPTLKRLTWEEAIDSAKELNVGGHKDWRLPTIEELEAILTKQSFKNSYGDRHYIVKDFLNTMPQHSCFWTSTEENEEYAWVVNFKKGYDYWRKKTLKYYALYVRKPN